jgi:hypothetical protein
LRHGCSSRRDISVWTGFGVERRLPPFGDPAHDGEPIFQDPAAMKPETPISLTSAKGVKAALLRSKTVNDGENEFEYTAPNGRRFEVRELGDASFFLSEFRPMARVSREVAGRSSPVFMEVPALKGLMGDPNAFKARSDRLLHDGDEVVFGGGGLGVATIYHPSLDAAAAALVDAIDRNEWYEHVDRIKLDDPDFQARLRRNEAKIRVEGRKRDRAMHELAVSGEHGIFKGLHSMMGPLHDDSKKRILSFLNEPSEPNWNDVYSLCVKGGTTLWQAWLQADPTAPRSRTSDGRWPRIPDADAFKAALRLVAGLENEEEADNDAEIVTPKFR